MRADGGQTIPHSGEPQCQKLPQALPLTVGHFRGDPGLSDKISGADADTTYVSLLLPQAQKALCLQCAALTRLLFFPGVASSAQPG